MFGALQEKYGSKEDAMAQNAVRILVIDDEANLLWALQHHLSDEGYEVHTARDGVQGLQIARTHRPHLIILDVGMPRMDGITVCQELRRDPSLATIPILFLTVYNTVDNRVKGLDEGGDDYLAKPFDIAELKARIRALLRRVSRVEQPEVKQTDDLLQVGSLVLYLRRYQVCVAGRAVPLTPIEFDLLYYLMRHPDEVFSSERLLQVLWGYVPNADSSIVRWHISNLRRKMEPDPAHPIYIRTVPRHGYILSSKQ